MIPAHLSASTERVVRKTLLLKIIGTFSKEFCLRVEATDRSSGWTKVLIDREEHGGEVMMLAIVLVRSINYEGVETGKPE